MCQQQYDRICRLDIRHRKSFRNSEYFPDHPLMFKRFRKEKIVEAKVAKSASNRNAMGMIDTIVTFQMVHGTLGMLDAIVTFQSGAHLEPTHRQPLFSISRAEIVFHARPVSVFIVKRANTCVFLAVSPLFPYPGCQRFLIFPHS